MSEDRLRISLRSGTKRKNRPVISAPRQISAPIQNTGSGPSSGNSIPLPRNDGSRPGVGGGAPALPRPSLPIQPGGKVCRHHISSHSPIKLARELSNETCI